MAKDKLPKVLIFRPPPCFTLLESLSSNKFRFIKAWDFESNHTQHFDSVTALITSSVGPTISSETLRQLPAVRLIISTSIGLDHLDLVECRRRRISVVNPAGLTSSDVADLAIGLLLDVLRRISAADRKMRRGLIPHYPLGYRLKGKQVGIVGLGNIGLEVAKRLEPFGCNILYNSTNPKPVKYPFYQNVSELAYDSDILILCCALTDQTHYMINKQVLANLGKEGVIVNVARGAVIDEKELVRCLMKGEIRGAGLDVFEHEPKVPKDLFSLDNVVLCPHVAALTEDSILALCHLVMANLDAFFAHKPLVTPVCCD